MKKIPNKTLSVLFLCPKYYYLHKMSRIRFHAAEAISKVSNFIWSGPEWENWNSKYDATENIRKLYKGKSLPDIVLCYQPHEIKDFSKIPFPTCINKDELFTEELPPERTVTDITESRIDLVISHQKNQLTHPLFKQLPSYFAYIPYCINKEFFKDYKNEKTIDILLIGNLGGTRYPLRSKMYYYLKQMKRDPRLKYLNIKVYPYPGYKLKCANDNLHVIDFASKINASKICLACSGKYHLKYAKYIEVPACRSLLMADLPCEDRLILENYMVAISSNVNYGPLSKTIMFYLNNEDIRNELTENGYQIIQNNYTQQHYANKFINIVKQYLSLYGSKKVW